MFADWRGSAPYFRAWRSEHVHVTWRGTGWMQQRRVLRLPAASPWLVSDFGSGRPVRARERSGPHPEGPWGVPNGSCPSGAQMSTGIGLLRAAQPRR